MSQETEKNNKTTNTVTKNKKKDEKERSMDSIMMEIRAVEAVTALNTVGVIYEYSKVASISTQLETQEKKQKAIIRNLNILNMQFKRWVSIFVGKHIHSEYNHEDLSNVIARLESRLNDVEHELNELKMNSAQGSVNPLHFK